MAGEERLPLLLQEAPQGDGGGASGTSGACGGSLGSGGNGGRGGRAKQFAVAFVVDVLALGFGLGMGWPATALPLLAAAADGGPPLPAAAASWLAFALCLAAMLATPVYHCVSERRGRRACGVLTALPGVASALLLLWPGVAPLLVARTLVGACFAGTFIYCPLYVAEMAEEGVRGALGVVIMIMRNSGILLSYVIGTYLSYYTVACISLIPPSVFLLSLLWLPESPVYLVRQGEMEKAVRAMKFFRSKHANVREEIEKMRSDLLAMEGEGRSKATVMELMRNKTARKGLLITFVLFCNQQLSGFYGIVSYTVMIFQESGSELSPNLCSIIVGTMLLIGTILAVLICDLTGRKILLIVSDLLMTVSLMAISLFFYLKSKGFELGSFHSLPLLCFSIYVIALNIGLSSLPVLIATELFSPRFTSLAMTITAPSTWFLTFLVEKYFPLVSDAIGIHGSALIFAIFCLMGCIFIILFLPETKNKSLMVILEELNPK